MITALYVILFVIILSAAIAGASAAPWLPTKAKDRDHVLDGLALKGNETIVDLGCGDGAMLFTIAKRHPGTHCIGYDISLLPLVLGWIRKMFGGYRNVHIRFGNLFTAPVENADVVFVFLLSKAYPRLISKFQRELHNHARIVVEAWPLPHCTPVQTLKAEGRLPVYIYEGGSCK